MSIQSFAIASPAAYPVAANVSLTFQPKKVTFQLDDSTAGRTITISLDGVNDHIKLSVDAKAFAYVCAQRHQQFWVKGTAAAALWAVAES